MNPIPASTGYTGAGATVINDNIDRHSPGNVVESHLSQDQHKNVCSEGIHAAHGGAGGPADHERCPSWGAGAHTDAPTRGERGPIDLDDTQPKSHAMMGNAQQAGAQGTQGSVLGAGPDTPVNVTPIDGQAPPENAAKEKAQVKTAANVAGVQEDLKNLRDRLADNKADDAKPSIGDRIKGFAVKTIDHTQVSLEGAKQKVTNSTTQPAATFPES